MIIPAYGAGGPDGALLTYQRFRDAGANFGGQDVVDVGGRDARWVQLLLDLGASVVHVVDPDAGQFANMVDTEVQGADYVYPATIEEWSNDHEPVAGAAVLNILPHLAGQRRFLDAVIAAVKPKGQIVVSATEAASITSVSAYMSRRQDIRVVRAVPIELVPPGSPHTFIQVLSKIGS